MAEPTELPEHLRALGWRGELPQDHPVARVTSPERGWVNVVGLRDSLDELLIELTSRCGQPVVGDWVQCIDVDGTWYASEILPRASLLRRRAVGHGKQMQPLVANVDYVLIVTAVGDDFSPRRTERYAAAVLAGDASPVVVLNKADVGLEDHLDQLHALLPSLPIFTTSATDGTGVDELRNYFSAGDSITLVGSSGVGKSTLTNALLGQQIQDTGDVREADDKGRHTTTRRQLLVSRDGLILIDTPGMREFGLWDAEAGISALFADVEALMEQCRFRDCGHASEPGCAITAAIDAGELERERWQRYLDLTQETASSKQYRDRDGKKAYFKEIDKAMRAWRKDMKRSGGKDR